MILFQINLSDALETTLIFNGSDFGYHLPFSSLLKFSLFNMTTISCAPLRDSEISEFLRQFVLVRGVRPRLYLNFLFRGNDVDNLCPGLDVKEAYGIVPPAWHAML